MTGWPERLTGRPPEIAPLLLGGVLRHTTADGTVAVRLSEVEAYAGSDDPGSHAYRGQTDRNAVMFGPPGHLYVYFTYGMHWCSNIVTDVDGQAGGVLLRAGEIVAGETLARARRGMTASRDRSRDLARGPARLCMALGIDRQHGGVDLTRGGLTFAPGPPIALTRISTGPRVGLRLAAETPWRFWITDDPTVSNYRPASPRRGSATQLQRAAP